ncbi:hypothetical protein CA7LBN_000665 [Candidozyma auris]|uniref:Ribosomal protein L16 n=2 Tax=Candidozyma auris TaxID=498019 RepID=A0A8F2VXX1_CANAR|nr:hypothetical protein CA7LBN_000665 [[Candida] auris]
MLGLCRTLQSSLGGALRTPQLLAQANTSTVFKRFKHEYEPRHKNIFKAFKGRVTVRTGGSVKGNSLEVGKYGLRLKSNGIRMAAIQLKEADKVIQRQLRGTGAKYITRFVCNTPVCVKGNQTRMGKGKGGFDHWAVRVPTGKILFEIVGDVHEKVAREALRKAGDKLPGIMEIVDVHSKIRVSPTTLVDKPEPVNWLEKMKEAPTKKWTNIEKSKSPDMSKDTQKLAGYALNQAVKLMESDTQVSTIDMNLLVNLNTNQSLNYIKLEQDLNEIEESTKKSQALQEEFESLRLDLNHIERQVDVMSEIIKELDGWTKELEKNGK